MTIENSVLNTDATLPSSNEGLTGSSGDGNSLPVHDLAQGYVHVPAPATVPSWMPQNSDDGENYVGDPFDRGGFAGRPMGGQR